MAYYPLVEIVGLHMRQEVGYKVIAVAVSLLQGEAGKVAEAVAAEYFEALIDYLNHQLQFIIIYISRKLRYVSLLP